MLSLAMERDLTDLEVVLNLTLDSSWLGVLDGQLALLCDDVHILLTGARPAHCSRPQLRLLFLGCFNRVGCLGGGGRITL